MEQKPVIFIAFQEQDNLGVGYVAAILLNAGYAIQVIDFRIGTTAILEQLRRLEPLVVGFSIIFQHNIDQFQKLISSLRESGIQCHFCAGGHYPSLRPVDLLNAIPGLDSVVLFDGEWTFLELVKALESDENWKDICSLAYRENGNIRLNPLRPLEVDLDRFPPPARPPLRKFALEKKFATILASRGCVHNCSFCSIREFYSRPPGPIKRVRKPEMVVREMELLHQEKDCSIFMFQDDDFPLGYTKGKTWVTDFCNLLVQRGLHNKIMWKINCRTDEVDFNLLSLMKQHGLFLVYLGIESGTDQGLSLMNKRVDVETNLRAATILKDLNILFDYGFMLFDPGSTFQTIVDNLSFLEQLCGDGSSPVTFCKMLPYAETDIERLLIAEGRLKGTPGREDYDFTDPLLDRLYEYMVVCFSDWIGDHEGILNFGRWSRHMLAVYRHYLPITDSFLQLEQKVLDIISESNQFFFASARNLVSLVGSVQGIAEQQALQGIKQEIEYNHKIYGDRMNAALEELEGMVR